MEVLYRKHPGTGLLVGTDGSVQLPKNGVHKAKTTFGYLHPSGYTRIGYNYKIYLVHRLVAETWIPNPENKPYIDHISRCRNDNRCENLRWATKSENQRNTAAVEKVTAEGRQHRFGPEYTLQWKGQKRVVFYRYGREKSPGITGGIRIASTVETARPKLGRRVSQ